MHTIENFVYVGSVVIVSTSPYEFSVSYFSTAFGFFHHGFVTSCLSGCNHNSYSLIILDSFHILDLKWSSIYHTLLVKVRASFLYGFCPSTLVMMGLQSSVSR